MNNKIIGLPVSSSKILKDKFLARYIFHVPHFSLISYFFELFEAHWILRDCIEKRYSSLLFYYSIFLLYYRFFLITLPYKRS